MATKRVLNFLWLNLDLPALADPEDGTIRQPLPPKYIETVRKSARAHPTTDVVLWVDSKRLTGRQMEFLRKSIETNRSNAKVKDLRTIPAYDQDELYNEPETNAEWRSCGQSSLIWRQVDAAKVLISLQGDYDQAFFSDLDHAHFGVTSPKVQAMLKKHGLMIGSYSDSGDLSIENQLWGFQRRRRDFFNAYYGEALVEAHNGNNAWSKLVSKVELELVRNESIPLAEICLPIAADGTKAEQPGHESRDGYNRSTPSTISNVDLTRMFNARSRRRDRPVSKSACKKAPVVAKKFEAA
ncbi:MAG: hypothetical protein EPN97_02970 [Alphaproteobacteria bacterium]|nr:MAG: hypothetical protein EPN97_02970 [Alphaproteobacteria bacterium]